MPMCLSVCLSVRPSVYLSVGLSVHLFVHPSICLCASLSVCLTDKVEGLQVDLLFGNITEVMDLSGTFLAALKNCSEDKQIGIGLIFTTYATRMKDVYGLYCRNHDIASALYEKVQTVQPFL